MLNSDNFSMNSHLSALLRKLAQQPTAGLVGQLQQLHKQTTERAAEEPQALLDMLFLNAIHKQFKPRAELCADSHPKHFEISQIYDLVINNIPLLSMSHEIVNHAIKHVIADGPHSVLIDFGIGRGIQTAKLIESMAKHSCLQTLTVIGVEPSHQALVHAGRSIARAAQHVAFKVVFKPLECLAENVQADGLRASLPDEFNKLAVNSSLTAHHIPSTAERIAFFEMIRSLQPDALLLTEPDSNHMETDWCQRVENAYIHYGTVFSLIDQLDIGVTVKRVSKLFFGQEIEDVVSLADEQRFKRHESAPRWLEYLAKTGFQIGKPALGGDAWEAQGVSFRKEAQGYLSVGHKGINVLSILHGKCC